MAPSGGPLKTVVLQGKKPSRVQSPCPLGAAMDSTASLSSGTRDCDRGGVSGLFPLGGADVDLEVHVPLAQHLGIGDDPAPAFKGDVVADLQDLPT
jgi:hypothetical protein